MGSTMWRSLSRLRKIVAVVVAALVAAILLSQAVTPAQATAQHPGYVAAIGDRAVGQTDPWGMASYFCTSYAAYRVNSNGTSWRSDGRYNAHQWDERARERGITVSATPKKGAIAVWEAASWNGYAGHVAYVESVNSNGTVNVSEYNYNVQHGYGSRNNIRAPKYIHFKVPSSQSSSGMPFGNFESIERAPGGAAIRGWAIDPNAANAGKGSIRIDFYVGTGSIAGRNPDKQLTANVSRLDVGRAYPKYGSNHGYDGFIELRPGSQRVCAYAINVGPGSNKQIGCKTITMPDYGSEYYLNNDFDGSYDLTVGYGRGTDEVIVGDWDGDGKDTLGVRRGNQYYLNNNFDDVHDIYTDYGSSADIAITGDWDGSGTNTLGVRSK